MGNTAEHDVPQCFLCSIANHWFLRNWGTVFEMFYTDTSTFDRTPVTDHVLSSHISPENVPQFRSAEKCLKMEKFLSRTAEQDVPHTNNCPEAPEMLRGRTSIGGLYNYRQCARSSSPDSGERYAGATSSAVMQPVLPSAFRRDSARA